MNRRSFFESMNLFLLVNIFWTMYKLNWWTVFESIKFFLNQHHFLKRRNFSESANIFFTRWTFSGTGEHFFESVNSIWKDELFLFYVFLKCMNILNQLTYFESMNFYIIHNHCLFLWKTDEHFWIWIFFVQIHDFFSNTRAFFSNHESFWVYEHFLIFGIFFPKSTFFKLELFEILNYFKHEKL